MLPGSIRAPSAATRGDNSTTGVVLSSTHRRASTTPPPKADSRPLKWKSVHTNQEGDGDSDDSETSDGVFPDCPPHSSSPYSLGSEWKMLPRKTLPPLEQHAQQDSESLDAGISRPPSSLSYGGSSDCSRIEILDEYGSIPPKKADNVPNINGLNSGGSEDPSVTRIISRFGEDNLREALVKEFPEEDSRHSVRRMAGNQHFDRKEGGTEYCNNPRERFPENSISSISAMSHSRNSSVLSDMYEPLTPIHECWAHSHTDNLSTWTDPHTDGLNFLNPRCREDTYGMANSTKPYHGNGRGERGTITKDDNNRMGGYLKYTEAYPQDEPAMVQRGLQETPFYTKKYPPMPREGTVPFVLCRHCLQLLEVPVHLPSIYGSIRKLRCGGCWKVLKFSTTPELGISNTNRIGKEPPPSLSPISLPFTFHVEKRDMRSPPPTVTNRREQRNEFCDEASPTSTVDNIWLRKPLDWSCSSSNCSDKPKILKSPSESSCGGSCNESPVHDGINSQYSKPKHVTSYYNQYSNQAKQGDSSPNYSQNPYKSPMLGSSLNQQATHCPTSPNPNMNAATNAPENPVEDASGNGGKSLTGLLKKGFKGILKGTLGGGSSPSKVFVNGHEIPHFEVVNVENLAGPIHPGSYWYDHRTGFWGIAGCPCRGIIPPCIEEFQRYPMARDCSHGNTGILVNGRELHEKDFAVLLKRGLPKTPGKSYSIYFSGKVVDDATDKEVWNLGMLAPSVAKRCKGYGMSLVQPNGECQ